jgi:hypothetical protein
VRDAVSGADNELPCADNLVNKEVTSMARNWYVATDASRQELLGAFAQVFFERPSFKERFKLSKGAQLRSQQVWEHTGAQGADVAAVLVRGGLREAVADSRRGTGSELGATIAMSVSQEEGRSVGQLWLANHSTFFGFNQQGDVLKAYSKLIGSKLEAMGRSNEVGKVK